MKIRVLVTAHGGDAFALRGGIFTRLKTWIIQHSNRTSVVSHAIAANLKEIGCRGEIVVAPMGVDTTRFSPERADPKIRETYCPTGPLILFVGRIVEKKGLRYLIEAMPSVARSLANARLLVIGDGPLLPVLQNLVAELKLQESVRFLGGISNANVPPFYASSDIFVGPSITEDNGDSEGFGLVFAEAMSCGLPVIGTNLPGIEDVIVPDVSGIIVKQKDSNALALAITRTLGDLDLRKNLKMNARQWVEQNFDWKIVTKKYCEILQQAATSL